MGLDSMINWIPPGRGVGGGPRNMRRRVEERRGCLYGRVGGGRIWVHGIRPKVHRASIRVTVLGANVVGTSEKI